MEKEQFLVKLRKLVELGRSKQNALDVAEINDFFTGDNLGPEQMDEIYSYLEHSNIDVVPISDDALLAEDDSLLMDDKTAISQTTRWKRISTWMRSTCWRGSERRIRYVCT